MKYIISVVLILLLISSISVNGQDTTRLNAGMNIETEIAPQDRHIYLLHLDSGQFAYGELNQKSLDVAINIFNPEKKKIDNIDETGRYLELFHIEATTTGIYSIEVLPYMAGSGLYSIEIKNIESLASSPEKQLDQLIEAYYPDDQPGGAVSVLCDRKIVYTKVMV